MTLPPKIGHLTSDHRMGRCFLARLAGDAINAVPAATGSNLRKLLGLLRRKAGRFALARREMPNQMALAPFRWAQTMTSDRRDRRLNYLAAA